MSKGSGGTRAGSSGNPRGLGGGVTPVVAGSNSRTETPWSAEVLDSMEKKVNSLKVPALGENSRIELDNGFSIRISHIRPGYGTGGFIQSSLYDPSGEKVDGLINHRVRYGGNGMAYFGSKTDATNEIKSNIRDFIQFRRNDLKRRTE